MAYFNWMETFRMRFLPCLTAFEQPHVSLAFFADRNKHGIFFIG